MDQGFKDIVTVVIAAWGAVTGSTAIALQVRQFRRDRAHLKVSAQLKFHNVIPPKPSVEVTVANGGRRPATTSKVWVKLQPLHWWEGLPWRAHKNRAALAQARPYEVLEGRSVTFTISGDDVPGEIDLARAKSIAIEDVVGKLWYSRGLTGQSELLQRRSLTPLKTRNLSANGRHAKLGLYIFSNNSCTIQVDYGTDNSKRRHSFHCGTEQIEDLYEETARKAEAFINGQKHEI